MNSPQMMAEIINALCKQKNITAKELLVECDLSPSAISNMIAGKSPRVDTIAKLAEALGCTIDYIIGRSEKPFANVGRDGNNFIGGGDVKVSFGDNLSPQERDLLQIFRNASGKKQVEIMNYIYKVENN